MKENSAIPWKRIVISSIISVFLVFVFVFINALLCSKFIISFKLGQILMFPVVFISSFIGCFFVKSKDKNIIYTVMSGMLTFVVLNSLGMLTANKINTEHTFWIFAVLCLSAVMNCIVKAIFK